MHPYWARPDECGHAICGAANTFAVLCHIPHSPVFSILQGHAVQACAVPVGFLWGFLTPGYPEKITSSTHAWAARTAEKQRWAAQSCASLPAGSVWKNCCGCSPRRPPVSVRLLGQAQCWPETSLPPPGNLPCAKRCVVRAFPGDK